MSPSLNMETFDTFVGERAAGAWKAATPSSSARATTATDFMTLPARGGRVDVGRAGARAG